MTDIVERLNGAMFDVKDKTRVSPDLWNPLALAICDATDEIERLREVLRIIAENKNYTSDLLARTALGEKE